MAENVQYEIGLKGSDFSNGIQKASQEAAQLDGKVNGLGLSMKNLAATAGAAFAGIGIANLVGEIVTAGADFELAEKGLATLLQSSEKAHTVFEGIKADAASTPFDVDSLLTANSALINAGEDATAARENVLALGNALAASGKGSAELKSMAVNLNQIKSIGKASAMDVRQFVMAGIPIYQLLADATGKTVDEVMEMDVSYELLTKALKDAGKEGGRFYNGLANASNTTAGKISNLGDSIKYAYVDIFKASQPAINLAIDLMAELANGVKGLVLFGVQHQNSIKAVGVAVLAGAAAWGLYTIGVGLASAGTTILAAKTWLLNAAMAANPVGLAIAGFAVLAGGVYYAWQKFEGFRGAVLGVWEVLKDVGAAMLAIGKALVMPSLENINAAIGAFKGIDLSKSYEKGRTNGEEQFREEQKKAKQEQNEEPGKKKAADLAKEKNAIDTPGELKAAIKALKKEIEGEASAEKRAALKMKMEAYQSQLNEMQGKKAKGEQGQGAGLTARAPQHFHINIGSLVKDLNIHTKEVSKLTIDQIRNMVGSVLEGAVNDVQRIAGVA